ncbi:MAG: hypothetical protein IH840_13050 [Candidatus Heimdallarchaeota archaeon]|nr:hypothetical protein [Candidatus Heimdallarchaeota archaeon]
MTWGLFTFLVPVIAVPVYIVIILTENNMNAKVARITAQNPRIQNLQSSTTAQSPPSNDVLTVTRTTPSNNAEQPTPVETGQASEEFIGPKEADPKGNSNEVNQVTKMSNQFCASCGAKNSLKAIFCNICGNKVVL